MKKTDSWFRPSFSDAINIAGIFATLFVAIYFGRWGLVLTRQSMSQADEIAKQQQSIKGWDSLIRYQSKQDSALSVAIMILDSQLMLNQKTQAVSNLSFSLMQSVEISRLNYAYTKLMSAYGHDIILQNSTHDFKNHVFFIMDVKATLAEQLDNKALLEDKKLADEWHEAYNKITAYQLTEKMSEDVTHAYYQGGDSAANRLSPKTMEQIWADMFEEIRVLMLHLKYALGIKDPSNYQTTTNWKNQH